MEDSYVEDYERGVDAIRRYGPENVTYIPRTGKCMKLKNQDSVRMFFEEYTRNGNPVYIIGVTNNRDDFNEYTRSAYVSLRTDAKDATVGRWADAEGLTYNDVIAIMSGISREQALKYKKQYRQISIVVIEKNGLAELI